MKTLTATQTDRLFFDWSKVTKENFKLQQIGSAIYATGSELAMLRLQNHYIESVKIGKARFFQQDGQTGGNFTFVLEF